jgi:DNA-binding transcriptional MerR regulator
MSRTFTIRQLTKELGVTSRTLRHYEDEGLLSPERRGQARIYHGRDRARLTLILRGRRVGFSLAEIKEILDLYNSEDQGASQLEHSRKKFVERIALLEKQRKDIDDHIAELKLAVTRADNWLDEHKTHAAPPQRFKMSGYSVMPAGE